MAILGLFASHWGVLGLFVGFGFLSRRLVAVTGEKGIGKSTLMAAAGRFAQLRKGSFREVRPRMQLLRVFCSS